MMIIYTYIRTAPRRESRRLDLGWHDLSNGTCLIWPRLFDASLHRVKDHRNSPQYSPLLKKICVRQVVSDKILSCVTPSCLTRPYGAEPERGALGTLPAGGDRRSPRSRIETGRALRSGRHSPRLGKQTKGGWKMGDGSRCVK